MMEEYIKAFGRMANNMVRASSILRKKVYGKKEFGMMGKGSNGKTLHLINNFLTIYKHYLLFLEYRTNE
jgi:hypothetical protein